MGGALWRNMGVPSGCQKVVETMCLIVRGFPSASLVFTFLPSSSPPGTFSGLGPRGPRDSFFGLGSAGSPYSGSTGNDPVRLRTDHTSA